MSGQAANVTVPWVPHSLDCSICREIPLDVPRLVKPCSHFFCRECLERALEQRANCPICNGEVDECRTDCASTNSRCVDCASTAINGPLKRSWEEIPVKCTAATLGCKWEGTIAKAKIHVETCYIAQTMQHQEENSYLKRKIGELERENGTLRPLRARVDVLEQEHRDLERFQFHVVPDERRLINVVEQLQDSTYSPLWSVLRDLSFSQRQSLLMDSWGLTRNQAFEIVHNLPEETDDLFVLGSGGMVIFMLWSQGYFIPSIFLIMPSHFYQQMMMTIRITRTITASAPCQTLQKTQTLIGFRARDSQPLRLAYHVLPMLTPSNIRARELIWQVLVQQRTL